jgi:hypothetical protein
MTILAGDQVEVVDETSPFYHLVGDVTARHRGRLVVQFPEKDRLWNYPTSHRECEFPEDSLGLVPPLR